MLFKFVENNCELKAVWQTQLCSEVSKPPESFFAQVSFFSQLSFLSQLSQLSFFSQVSSFFPHELPPEPPVVANEIFINLEC